MFQESQKDFQAKEREKSTPNQALTQSHGVQLQKQNSGAMNLPVGIFCLDVEQERAPSSTPEQLLSPHKQPPLSLPDGAALPV